jgi:RNA polymerase sigma factor (sigma-70 family)
VTGARTTSFPHLPSRVVDAQAQRVEAERPADGRFSFADTPRLTAALAAGDESAYRWLHAQWNARLIRYCFALARGDDALAGEIAQATYLRVVRHIRELPDETALWNWLACAARSAASDLRRRHGALVRFAGWLQSKEPTNGPRDAGGAPEQELLAALDHALARLDGEERNLIEGRYFHGRSLEEIGMARGLSVRAVEGRLARLRGRLRGLVAEALQREESGHE